MGSGRFSPAVWIGVPVVEIGFGHLGSAGIVSADKENGFHDTP
jgi:hypothetical protein